MSCEGASLQGGKVVELPSWRVTSLLVLPVGAGDIENFDFPPYMGLGEC